MHTVCVTAVTMLGARVITCDMPDRGLEKGYVQEINYFDIKGKH